MLITLPNSTNNTLESLLVGTPANLAVARRRLKNGKYNIRIANESDTIAYIELGQPATTAGSQAIPATSGVLTFEGVRLSEVNIIGTSTKTLKITFL